ncbi:MAG: CBS domain-containing protein [Bacillota bacterium]
MKLRELMTQNVRTCRQDSQLTDVARIMAEVNCGCVPVVEGERVVGVITDRDIVLRAVAEGRDIRTTPVKECMTTPVITAAPDMDAHRAAELMAAKQIRRLCVVDGERLVGIVALGDMATERIHVDEAGKALSDISVPSRPGAH